MRKIDRAGGLIAIMSRRDQVVDSDRWTTSPWVSSELGHARAQGKQTIALVEDGVDTSGMGAPYERIPLDRADLAPALLALSETIGIWKRTAGRKLPVRILPDDAAVLALGGNGAVTCQYRFHDEGEFTDWVTCRPILKPGGTFLFLDGVLDHHEIQVEISARGQYWVSPVTSQAMAIDLKPGGSRP